MDLNQWRLEVKQQAVRLSDLVRQAEQLAPGVVYGATATLAVAPLVAAAQSGNVPYGELVALLGGMGINLLTKERGASPLDLDCAALDFLLDAVQPRYPQKHRAAEDVAADAFNELYQAREWLRNFQLSAALQKTA